MRDTKVVIFRSPQAGTPVMEAAPLAALDLPIKTLVWADEDQTKVSYTSPVALADRAAELFEAAASHEAALLAALRRAVPGFADWCVVDYYTADRELRAVHSGYPDARKEALMMDIRRRYRAERGENGDTLVLHTDGLTEATRPGWTRAELHERLKAAPTETLPGLLEYLEALAVRSAEHGPRDDIALLALRAATSAD